MTKQEKTTAVAAANETALSPFMSEDIEREVGGGFEGADQSSYAMPLVVVLQALSPQVRDGEQRIEGAREGDFFDSTNGQTYDGKKGILVVPAAYQHRVVEWNPRDEGGGFVASHEPAAIGDLNRFERDDKGRILSGHGTEYMDTRYHYCVLIDEETGDVRPIVFPLSSTQIKKSRLWMSMMSNLKVTARDGKRVTPPTFANAYRITTVTEKNAKGQWKGVSISLDHALGANEEHVYLAAKTLRDQVAQGLAKPAEEATPDASESAGDAEFKG